jgi:hypothetical protein
MKSDVWSDVGVSWHRGAIWCQIKSRGCTSIHYVNGKGGLPSLLSALLSLPSATIFLMIFTFTVTICTTTTAPAVADVFDDTLL